MPLLMLRPGPARAPRRARPRARSLRSLYANAPPLPPRHHHHHHRHRHHHPSSAASRDTTDMLGNQDWYSPDIEVGAPVYHSSLVAANLNPQTKPPFNSRDSRILHKELCHSPGPPPSPHPPAGGDQRQPRRHGPVRADRGGAGRHARHVLRLPARGGEVGRGGLFRVSLYLAITRFAVYFSFECYVFCTGRPAGL